MLAGVGLFLYVLIYGIFHITDNLTQIVVPGQKELTLQPNLKYTIFLEEESVVDGKVYSLTGNLAGLACRVTSETSGKNIELRSASISTNYNLGSRSGHSVLEFFTEEAGVYRIACGYGDDREDPQAVLAVGSGLTERIFRIVAGSLLAMFGGGGLGAVILVGVFIFRERAKKRLNSAIPSPL